MEGSTNKKVLINTKKVLALGIIFLIVLVVGATYAYWGARASINFNTATITYETGDKLTVTLNGTNGIITLGTITSSDMTIYKTNKIYYASKTGKTTTPTEETIGTASPSSSDLNVYSCNFSLSLTHSGTNDLIDKFLSNNYINRSSGQLIITVNGVEYDINNGFPNTISGTLETSVSNLGTIDVGMKFINLRNVDQDYLAGTNGAININIDSIVCEPTGESTLPPSTVKYWAALKENDYRLLGIDSTAYTNYYNAKKYDDYHDLINVTLYGITAPNMSFGNYIIYNFNNEFPTLSACEDFIDDFPNFEFGYAINYPVNVWECEYNSDNNNYVIIGSIDPPNLYGGREAKFSIDSLYDSLEECEDFLDFVIANDNIESWNGTYDNNSLSCSQIDINWNYFTRETRIPIMSDADKWELFYTNTIYHTEDECLSRLYKFFNGGYGTVDPNSKSYCLSSQGYYLYQKHFKYDDFFGLEQYYPEYVSSKIFNKRTESILFESETACQDFITDNYNSNTITDYYYDNTIGDYVEMTANTINSCVQTRTMGEIYYEYKIELCLYNNDKLVCIDINDDEVFDNVDSIAASINAIGIEAEASHESQGNDGLRNSIYAYGNDGLQLSISGLYNWYGDTGIDYHIYNGVYACKVNQNYGAEYATRCGFSNGTI